MLIWKKSFGKNDGDGVLFTPLNHVEKNAFNYNLKIELHIAFFLFVKDVLDLGYNGILVGLY